MTQNAYIQRNNNVGEPIMLGINKRSYEVIKQTNNWKRIESPEECCIDKMPL